MEVEHNIIGMNNAVRCASVIALPLAARIPGSQELRWGVLVKVICTFQSLQCSSEQTRDTPRLPPMSLLSVSMQGKQETDAGVHTIKQSNLQKERSYKPYNLEIE